MKFNNETQINKFNIIFKEINEIPPGHYLTFYNNKIIIKKYWSHEAINITKIE
jgi:asparagine synthetase B (glutamine-hydrolysing)